MCRKSGVARGCSLAYGGLASYAGSPPAPAGAGYYTAAVSSVLDAARKHPALRRFSINYPCASRIQRQGSPDVILSQPVVIARSASDEAISLAIMRAVLALLHF